MIMRKHDQANLSLVPQLVEVTDVRDAADAQVAPHVGRHRQKAVSVQLTILHLKKDTRALIE